VGWLDGPAPQPAQRRSDDLGEIATRTGNHRQYGEPPRGDLERREVPGRAGHHDREQRERQRDSAGVALGEQHHSAGHHDRGEQHEIRAVERGLSDVVHGADALDRLSSDEFFPENRRPPDEPFEPFEPSSPATPLIPAPPAPGSIWTRTLTKP